jgi:hypothetical protein
MNLLFVVSERSRVIALSLLAVSPQETSNLQVGGCLSIRPVMTFQTLTEEWAIGRNNGGWKSCIAVAFVFFAKCYETKKNKTDGVDIDNVE